MTKLVKQNTDKKGKCELKLFQLVHMWTVIKVSSMTPHCQQQYKVKMCIMHLFQQLMVSVASHAFRFTGANSSEF